MEHTPKGDWVAELKNAEMLELRATNAALLSALEAMLSDRQTQDYGQPTDTTLDLARAAILAAKGEAND